MTASNKNHIIQSTFHRAVAEPSAFALAFRTRLLDRDPSLRRLFTAGNDARDAAIVALLGTVVGALNDERAMTILADSIAAKLLSANIQPRHYGAIGQALLDALAAQLGPAWTEAVRDAWADAYVRTAEAVMAARYNPMELVA